MDELVYSALSRYYQVLGKLGYYKYDTVYRLLLLSFYKNFVYHDYRGLVTPEDYSLIEKALNCLFGTTCLIPYPDYLKMGKLHIGQISELSQRIKAIEDTEVVKVISIEEDADTSIVIEPEE
jgi:hypothetical protein